MNLGHHKPFCAELIDHALLLSLYYNSFMWLVHAQVQLELQDIHVSRYWAYPTCALERREN